MATHPTERAPRIIVVDDDADMLLLTRLLLEEAFPGLEVRTARNGPAALKALEEEPVHVVVCDFRMPGMDGLRVLQETARLAPEARRILMTASSDPGIEWRAKQDVGVDVFLRKALSPDDLLEAVAHSIGLPRLPAAP